MKGSTRHTQDSTTTPTHALCVWTVLQIKNLSGASQEGELVCSPCLKHICCWGLVDDGVCTLLAGCVSLKMFSLSWNLLSEIHQKVYLLHQNTCPKLYESELFCCMGSWVRNWGQTCYHQLYVGGVYHGV